MKIFTVAPTYITFNLVLLLSANIEITLSAGVTIPEAAVVAGSHALNKGPPEEERLDILYNNHTFKEIEPDVLVVDGEKNLNHVILTCKSSTRSSTFFSWKYHGVEENVVDPQQHKNSIWLEHFSAGPPVVRMECVDENNSSISNNTIIYRGDNNGKPPYLYNHGKSAAVTIYNESTVRLPCLLNYPLDHIDNVELQLFKDGVQVENKNNCLNYTPEYGYFLNLTKIEQPFGLYECRVVNSSRDDFLTIELTEDDVLRAEIQVAHIYGYTSFYEKYPIQSVFHCKVPSSKFEDKFEWFYLWKNGSYTAFSPEKSNMEADQNSELYVDSVKLSFPSIEITHLVCRGYLKYNGTSYNNTYTVDVKEGKKPEITNDPSRKIIFYDTNLRKNLTCKGVGDPIAFTWLKNGEPVKDLNVETWYTNPERKSTLSLNPSAGDVDSVYTCQVDNFLGNATFDFRVQLKPEEPNTEKVTLIAVGICLAALTILLLLLFTFYRIKFERRRFSEEQIRLFFNGIRGKEVPYNEFGEQVENFESVEYDTKKEINIDSLNFVRELKGGNFGKVQFGYYLNMTKGYNMPVAIKSIKDDPRASQEDVDYALVNFLKEIKIMQVLGEHSNVVRYVGAVTSDLSKYSAYLVVEYCSEGDLATYLKTLKRKGGSFYDDIQGLHNQLSNGSGGYSGIGSMNGVVLRTSHLIKWAEDIACGMEYIASKNLVHRDIAARNVLLAYEGHDCNHPDPGMLTAKISDFGLSRNLQECPKDYYPIIIASETNRSRSIALPLRWISLEALETLKFTTESDVWAYGVTLWEMFTLGDSPYRELVDGSDLRTTLITHLKHGNVLAQPEFAPEDIWETMLHCWNENPADRPSFSTLREILHAINENRNNQVNQFNQGIQPQPSNTGYSTVNMVEMLTFNGDYDDEEYDSQSVHEYSDEQET